jgi:hypothetical protein
MIHFLLALLSFAVAQEPNLDLQKNQLWSGSQINGLQVKIDSVDKQVSVSFKQDLKNPPRSISILFFDEIGNPRTLELHALQPVNQLKRYSGHWTDATAGPLPEVAVGFELRIPITEKDARVVRSQDLKRVR